MSILFLVLAGIIGVFVSSDWAMSYISSSEEGFHSSEELKHYNDSLERSERYRRIIPDVMKEVYRVYAKNEIEEAEEHLNRMGEVADSTDLEYSHSEREKINKAKSLLATEPEKAAELYFRMGTCQDLWSIQKSILKEKYGITWYTPSELNPNSKYD